MDNGTWLGWLTAACVVLGLVWSVGYALFNERRRRLEARPRVEVRAWHDDGQILVRVRLTNTQPFSVRLDRVTIRGRAWGGVSYALDRREPRHSMERHRCGGFEASPGHAVEPSQASTTWLFATPARKVRRKVRVSLGWSQISPGRRRDRIGATAIVEDEAFAP